MKIPAQNLDRIRVEMGFKNIREMTDIAEDWEGLFGEPLPLDYYHPRDRRILDDAIDVASYISPIILK